MEGSEYRPVFVFIDGIFGGGVSNHVRDHLRKKYPTYCFLDLSCGPVSSVADRAVECFFELYGGLVDYSCGLDGETLEIGHDRFGRLEAGLLGPSNWSETAPIHIFAYSLGAPTARYLQYLLAKQVNTILHFISIPIGLSFSAYSAVHQTQIAQLQAFVDATGRPIRTSASWIASICTCQVISLTKALAKHSAPGLCGMAMTAPSWCAGSEQRDGCRLRGGALSEDAGARDHVPHVVVRQIPRPPTVPCCCAPPTATCCATGQGKMDSTCLDLAVTLSASICSKAHG
jgi:hypothetical protein